MRKKLKNELKIFLTAIAFFTRIPVKIAFGEDKIILCKSLKYLSVIGLIVGSVEALIFWFSQLILPINISVLLALLGVLVLTGGLHEDGFIDVCDAHGGRGHLSQKEIIHIMQDSRIGAFGLLGYVGLFLLKYETLKIIAGYSNFVLIAVFTASQALSRLGIFIYVLQNNNMLVDYCHKSNFVVSAKFTKLEITFVLICGLFPLILFFKYSLAISLIIILFLTIKMLSRYFNKWLQGYTGDCLGFAQQIIEVIFYLSLVVFHGRC